MESEGASTDTRAYLSLGYTARAELANTVDKSGPAGAESNPT